MCVLPFHLACDITNMSCVQAQQTASVYTTMQFAHTDVTRNTEPQRTKEELQQASETENKLLQVVTQTQCVEVTGVCLTLPLCHTIKTNCKHNNLTCLKSGGQWFAVVTEIYLTETIGAK